MSGNHEHSGPPGEKPSAPPAGETERGRAISGSPPPTDDLDAEWDSSPADAAPEKPAEKPSVRPGSVVVRTSPPPPMVAAGTDAGNTLLGVAPPAVALQAQKSVVSAIPRAAAIPAEASAAASDAVSPVAPEAPAEPQKTHPEPAKSEAEPPKPEPVTEKAAEKSASSAKPELASVRPAKVVSSSTEVSISPDSVAASSLDHRTRGAAEEPVPSESRRSSRGVVIAAAAAVVIFGAWYGLRSGGSAEPGARAESSPPAPVAQVTKAEPAQQPAPPPAAPAEAVAGDTAAKDPEPSAPPSAEPAAANGKKVVIVKVRPTSARFYYKGKKVGGSPMRVELEPGEKRSFEVGHPAFVTRKVVIDGSEPEVLVGLHPKGAPQHKAPAGEAAEAHP